MKYNAKSANEQAPKKVPNMDVLKCIFVCLARAITVHMI